MFLDDVADYIKRNLQGRLYIQTHNFPDADAVSSARALQVLLEKKHCLTAGLLYDGSIQRTSLERMIDQFRIPLLHNSEVPLKDDDFIIIVDGCKWRKNVTDLTGEEIAVIDHHEVESPEGVPFCDIRPDYGACSTILTEYFDDYGIPLDKDLASLLLIGLLQDTDQLTRGVSDADIKAFNTLYPLSDQKAVQYSLRNSIELSDLDLFKRVIENLTVTDAVGLCYIPDGCPLPLLGILGDFFLSLEEIEFVALFARNGGRINVSFRNEIPGVNAARIIEKVLEGIGSGGGHNMFAGGIIPHADSFQKQVIFDKVLKEVSEARMNNK